MLWHKVQGAGGTGGGGGGEGWNISTTSYVQFFSVQGQEVNPTGVHFSSDGTNMYVIGSSGDDVNQYSLSTAWNISTASYVRNFNVADRDTRPESVFFKPDGTQMFVLGGSGDDVITYSLSTPWDISTASYTRAFALGDYYGDEAPSGLFLSDDGTRMYVCGRNGDVVVQYSVSPAWLISSGHAVYVRSQTIFSPSGVTFKPDGTKMYVIDSSENVEEYDLSTAWDISTTSLLRSFSASSQDTSMSDIFFRTDGQKMYLVGGSNDRVYEYNVGA